MYVTTDAEIHREYVKNFIAGRAEPNSTVANSGESQINQRSAGNLDWQVHAAYQPGRNSQFWNVLVGQMSLWDAPTNWLRN